jgi:hypothetical protein
MTAGHDAPARLIVFSSICRLSESLQASPRLASSRIFPGSAKVNLLGRGVFRSASRNWTCHPDLEKNDM